jgi:hypothetical protein
MPAKRFYETLTAAVNDILEHGYDSSDRLQHWLVKLRETARGALVPERLLVEKLRYALGRAYRHTAAPSKLARLSRTMSGFTVDMLKPKLRSELNRRILASADLIRLNRDASIQRTLQRFAGWATSIPRGGTETTKRKEIGRQIRRGIAALPFEERRVIIDQGHKLTASIRGIVAVDGGAIAAVWKHVPEGPPEYDARPEHERRDGKIFIIRDNWALRDGLMKVAGRPYTDEITAPAEEPFCRCTYDYLYALRDLPADMLTAKGQMALKEARKHAA